MRILNGLELAEFIKERQLHQARSIRQSLKVIPRLAIVRTGENSVNDMYIRLKRTYGEDIMIEVDIYCPTDDELLSQIEKLNQDLNVHGIIIQLPLNDQSMTAAAVNAVFTEKDVDGLGDNPSFTPATAMAINWLLAGYNIDLSDKKIAIIGKGRLVGAPLAKLWKESGYDVLVCDTKTVDLGAVLREADVIVSAAGVPGLITNDMISPNAVVVDAGTTSENGKIVGDLADDVRTREDITLTPVKGGVGPLTVAALFDNVLLAARNSVKKKA